MKKNYSIALLLFTIISLGQTGAPSSYYDGFNFNLTGAGLKNALATKISETHTNFLSYTPGVWEASKVTDLDPNNTNNVLLVYGFENGTDGSVTNDRSRSKTNNGGNSGQWNREHVYAKSLGTPALLDGGSGANSDAGEDAHHLRPSDVQWNNSRGNLKFATGSGNSGPVTNGWYPGDEWKGDIARMMMYMYLRYPTQCLPTNVGTGTSVVSDTNMVNLFLQWNIEDPVSAFEDARNTYHGDKNNTYAQGNRNPFIDNPYLATVIWGGTAAQNRWPNMFLSSESYSFLSRVNVYPNPSNNKTINIQSENNIDSIELVNINGQLMQSIKNPVFQNNTYTLTNLPQGFYLLKLTSENQSITKKVIVN